MKIRLATLNDCKQILNIYKPYVEQTSITFEYIVPTIEEFEQRFNNISSFYPYLVAVENDKVIGYAYASRYRLREAYNWGVELSIYLDSQVHHQGIGTKLYSSLLNILKIQGFFKAYACITYPNPMSINFHEKYGFNHIGMFPKTGYKFDKWLDTAWLELDLQDSNVPKPIITIKELSKEAIDNCLIK